MTIFSVTTYSYGYPCYAGATTPHPVHHQIHRMLFCGRRLYQCPPYVGFHMARTASRGIIFSVLMLAQFLAGIFLAAIYAPCWHKQERRNRIDSGLRHAWLRGILRYGFAKLLKTQFAISYSRGDTPSWPFERVRSYLELFWLFLVSPLAGKWAVQQIVRNRDTLKANAWMTDSTAWSTVYIEERNILSLCPNHYFFDNHKSQAVQYTYDSARHQLQLIPLKNRGDTSRLQVHQSDSRNMQWNDR
jgi:hypothetical protein